MTELPFSSGSIIVSCQASRQSPFYGPRGMAAMAAAAASGGASGIRANGAADIAAIRAITGLPIIGISKSGDPNGVHITPTFASAAAVVEAGASLVAIDATPRARPGGEKLASLIDRIHRELQVAVMADIDCVENAVLAVDYGADLIATTLSGYTPQTASPGDRPDLALVGALATRLQCPVVAEGRYVTPADLDAAFEAGAYAVVVGTAITNPAAITRRLVQRR